MALARLALRNLQTKISSSTFTVSRAAAAAACDVKDDRSPCVLSKGYATSAASPVPTENNKELAADQNTKKFHSKRQERESWRPWNSLFPPRRDLLGEFSRCYLFLKCDFEQHMRLRNYYMERYFHQA